MFTGFFGGSVGHVLLLFIGLLQQLLAEIKGNPLPLICKNIIDCLCYDEV